MAFLFKGQICIWLCEDFKINLANSIIRLYKPEKQESIVLAAATDPKNTFLILDEKQSKAKASRLIAETRTNDKGQFEFDLSNVKTFDGSAFEVDALIETASESIKHKPLQVSLTTLQAQWRQRDNDFFAAWQYCIPRRYWCAMKARLGIWSICGRVTSCETQQALPNLKVTAFDRDWLQDDELGSAITNLLGYFYIDYERKDFVPGTLLDIELIGGPDIYFHVDTPLGAPIHHEDPSRGRDADRENRGQCFNVDLCVDGAPVVPQPDPIPHFIRIGKYNYNHDIDSSPSGSGFTLDEGRAFYGINRLNGILAKRLNSQPMEYQFQFRELNGSGMPITPWKNVEPSMIAPTHIGDWQWFDLGTGDLIEKKVWVHRAADALNLEANIVDGWIQVPQGSNTLAPEGFFVPNNDMIKLNSRTLTSFVDTDLSGLVTGASSTSTGKPLVQNKHFAIRMRVREVGNPASETDAGECQHVAINNSLYDNIDSHPAWFSNPKSNRLAVAMVDVAELQSDGCGGITNSLSILYTAAHPNLGTCGISMTGPGGPYHFSIPTGPTPPDRFGTAIAAAGFDISSLQPCAYLITLSVNVLLDTGDDKPDPVWDQIAFCKRNP
ncbi:MAG: carboxypeptidase regulatory-like domain-containing protein [Gammaproteobacteria bacterium]|nr:carboxypeptidase regulatory-like domain-containing protein [Gammaproteobacteria bacterium]MDH5731397.1 carboxypeptidase regulatory-like domain-containing protein [Gammaproteobacteria bacterium]